MAVSFIDGDVYIRLVHMFKKTLFQLLDPCKRIGCEDMGGYDPLKSHPFFESTSWDDLHLQTPPKLTPYLPAMSEDDEDCYGNVKPSCYIQSSCYICLILLWFIFIISLIFYSQVREGLLDFFWGSFSSCVLHSY